MTGLIQRAVPVEIEVKGDGRTVEAYATVYDVDAEIHDHEGHYKERITRGAFKRAINRAKPQGSRTAWKTQVYFNHARTPLGTPSERWQDPIGVTQHIEEDSTGLLTVTRYLSDENGERALTMIREGAVQGQSFTGEIVRSTPELRRGQRRRPIGGELETVTRTELGLREYGPTPSPAYEEAVILGMRSLDLSRLLDRPDAVRALRELLDAAPDEDSADEGADPDGPSPEDEDSPAPVAAARSTPPDNPLQRRLSVALRARGINP